MQIRYTSKAKKAIDQASKMSKSLHHHYIGTEHILIGLLKEGTGVAAQVLNDNGVELDKVMQLIEELIAPDAQVLTAEAKEYSPRALQVLEGAAREAARFHAEEIGTEHILIAMMKETECVASRLLNTLAVNIQKMYVDILIAMGELLLMAGFTIPAFQNSPNWESNILLQIMVYMMMAEYTLIISRS